MTLLTFWNNDMKLINMIWFTSVLAAIAVPGPAFAHRIHEVPSVVETNTSDVQGLLRAFRKSGKDAYLDKAWRLIEPELSEKASAEWLLNAALVAQAQHRFDEALALTKRVLEIRPDSDQTWLLVNAIQLVKGNAEPASQACKALKRSSLIVTFTCQARVALITGNEEIAKQRLLSLLNAPITHTSDPMQLAWSRSVAGDLASVTGDKDEATKQYRLSLALEESTQVRSALVDVLIDNQHFDAAGHALETGDSALALDIRRMIVARHVRPAHDHQHNVDKVDRTFKHWIQHEDWLHAREMARFYLDVKDEPALAVRLAKINITIQKEPEDQRLLERALAKQAALSASNQNF